METKRVNIYPREPITSTNPPIRGNIYATTTLLSDIKECLINNAIVEEILPDGTTIPLTLENKVSISIKYLIIFFIIQLLFLCLVYHRKTY